ncbi:hypothetical protein [Nocardia abscessus]|uniref:hypothetical protein n=1 Tax=Nocardia abscessus TaxID=120957 RepID=UPI0012F76194|nr:hypothetical protein [Nocardia abscessus]MCC3332535.1 hypothetical protein [Nocardia abscessus]
MSDFDVPDAAATDLPSVLAEPPWWRYRRPLRTVIDSVVCHRALSLRWRAGERQQWAQTPLDVSRDWLEGTQANAARNVTVYEYQPLSPYVLALAPPDLARRRVREPVRWPTNGEPAVYRRLLGLFEDDAADFVMAAVPRRPNSLASVLEPVDGTAVSIFMARWLYSANRRRTVALRWFDRHLDGAALDLIAIALGRTGRDHFRAAAALRVLAEAGYRDALTNAADRLDPRAPAGVAAILDTDPRLLLPKRIPKPSRWIVLDRLPRILLHHRRSALPSQAVIDLITMLMMCRPGRDYAGVQDVINAVDPASSVAFARALLDGWVEAEYPIGDYWVLHAQTVHGCGLSVQERQRFIAASQQWQRIRRAHTVRRELQAVPEIEARARAVRDRGVPWYNPYRRLAHLLELADDSDRKHPRTATEITTSKFADTDNSRPAPTPTSTDR